MSVRPRSMGTDHSNTRYATCGGVVWLDNEILVTVSLLTHTMQMYRWNPARARLVRVQNFPFHEDLDYPENLDFSQQLGLVAISNYGGDRLSLFEVGKPPYHLKVRPSLEISVPHGYNTHGISFSPGGDLLCYTTIKKPGVVGILRLTKDGSGNVTSSAVDVLENIYWPQVPKGVSLSPCMKFLAVCFGPNAGFIRDDNRGTVAVYRVSRDFKIEPDPITLISEDLGLRCAEDIKFSQDGDFVAVTDQVSNVVCFVPFDSETGQLSQQVIRLANPAAELDFPHGVGFSPDGKHLAISNYGSDRVTVYSLN